MTHNTLLSKINHYDWVQAGDLTKALDSVAELHKPVIGSSNDFDFSGNDLFMECCHECIGQEYPCLTIQAIEREVR